MNLYEKEGKFLALILRHNPTAAGITLDKHGWANVKELINGMNDTGHHITMKILEEIVKLDNKQRFSFDKYKSKIRANQGHSIPVDLELIETEPPTILYHGTAAKYLSSILEKGIEKRSRQYVHLSDTYDTAVNVGKRHGNPVVIEINAKMMFNDGYKFYLSENKVWLTDYVPIKYLIRPIFEEKENNA